MHQCVTDYSVETLIEYGCGLLPWRRNFDGKTAIEEAAGTLSTSAVRQMLMALPDDEFARQCSDPFIWGNATYTTPQNPSDSERIIARFIVLVPQSIWPSLIFQCVAFFYPAPAVILSSTTYGFF